MLYILNAIFKKQLKSQNHRLKYGLLTDKGLYIGCLFNYVHFFLITQKTYMYV